MKKMLFRAEAALIAVSVFFCSIVYQPIRVEASAVVVTEIIKYALYAIGYSAVDNLVIDPILEGLGWKSADIQVDENGNVILSEAQMNELKEAVKGYTQDENGNDKYGMYLYESTAALQYRNFLGINAHFDPDYWQDRGNVDLVRGLTDVWFVHSNYGSYCNAPPAGSIWVCPSPSSQVVYFYESGTYSNVTPNVFQLYWEGSNWVWHEREQAAGSGSVDASYNYYGVPHTCFRTLEGAQKWEKDNNPYTLVAPTYTSGDLVIPADQLHDPDNPVDPVDPVDPDNPDDPDENLDTELGVLQAILKWVKKIYNQVVVGNIINAVDTVAQVMETAKVYIDEALEDVSAIGELTKVLDTKFPFSIPQDILLILTVFEAEPQTPVFKIPFRADFGGPTGIKIDETIVIDFSDFDECIDILKWFLSIIWLWGLVMITPKFIDIGGFTGQGGGSS